MGHDNVNIFLSFNEMKIASSKVLSHFVFIHIAFCSYLIERVFDGIDLLVTLYKKKYWV